MSHAAYPTADQVGAELERAGITSTSQARQEAVEAAIAAWNAAVGYVDWPWLAETGDSDWTFDPAGSMLFLRGGYVSITSVTTGISYNSTTGAAEGGTPRVLNVGYLRNPSSGTPIRSLRWLGGYPCGIRSIIITGRRGFTTTIPDDVWNAIRAKAASIVYGSAYNASSNGLKSINIGSGDLAVTFGGSSELMGSWEAQFKAAATNPNYRAVSM